MQQRSGTNYARPALARRCQPIKRDQLDSVESVLKWIALWLVAGAEDYVDRQVQVAP